MSALPQLATAEHAPALSALAREVVSQTYTDLGSAQELSDWITYAYAPQQLMAYPGIRWLYVGEPSHPDGMGYLVMEDDGMALLGGLYVRTPGQGIGSQLIQYRLQLAVAEGASQARCLVFASNQPAQRLLAHYGFIEHARTQNKVREPGEPFPEAWVVELRCPLP